MSDFLGYHPAALDRLRVAMTAAADELATIRCDDSAAREAIAAVRSAERLLREVWLPFVGQLRNSSVTVGYLPVRIDDSDLRLATLFALQGNGWQVVERFVPMIFAAATADGEVRMTTLDAVVLADALAGGALDELLDTPEELEWLGQQLASVAADVKLAEVFAARLPATSARWIEICNRLAYTHLGLDEGARAGAERAIAGAAAVIGAAGAPDDLLEQMEPYAAALVVTRMTLDPTELASASYAIAKRWWIGPDPGTTWADEGRQAERTTDLLFRHVAEDPEAAAELVVLAGEHPPVLFVTAYDLGNVAALLDAGTDPTVLDVADAGATLPGLLEWITFFHDRVPAPIGGDAPSYLDLGASLSVRWLPYFGSHADEWGWTRDRGDEVLRVIVRDGQALDELAAGLETLAETILSSPLMVEGDVDTAELQTLASTFTQLMEAFRAEGLREAAQARGLFGLALAIGHEALALVPLMRSFVLSRGLELAESRILDQLEAWHVIPPGAETAGERQDALLAQETIGMVLVVVASVLTELVAAGVLPQSAVDRLALTADERDSDCPPAAWLDRIRDDIDELPLDAASRDGLHHIVSTFVNDASAAQFCRR